MPIYEYECQDCQHQMEALQKISDDPLEICPECNKAALKKLVSAAGFRLKGSGWYETDFKGGNKKNLTDGDTAKNSAPKEGKSKNSSSESASLKKSSNAGGSVKSSSSSAS